jgi:hypothetical protein
MDFRLEQEVRKLFDGISIRWRSWLVNPNKIVIDPGLVQLSRWDEVVVLTT